MSLVTSVGGLSAWTMRYSRAGAVAGLGVGALFATGGFMIALSICRVFGAHYWHLIFEYLFDKFP